MGRLIFVYLTLVPRFHQLTFLVVLMENMQAMLLKCGLLTQKTTAGLTVSLLWWNLWKQQVFPELSPICSKRFSWKIVRFGIYSTKIKLRLRIKSLTYSVEVSSPSSFTRQISIPVNVFENFNSTLIFWKKLPLLKFPKLSGFS